jgi:uncharacterized protein
MRLHLENETPPTRITSYGDGYVVVNEERHTTSLILFPNRVESNWAISSPEDLTDDDIVHLVADRPAIILVGTGRTQRFPPSEILQPAYAQGIGVEVMNTMAACRTFNVLASENRDVVAAIIIEPAPEP